jgi:hypothetical protein
MRGFKDIKKGDTVTWERDYLMFPHPRRSGVAVRIIRGGKGLVDVWMCQTKDNTPGCLQPVTPMAFRECRKAEV